MRPGQQHNKRGRGRNRHRSSGGGGGSNSGGGNPLSRVYESNGPDVKVRGTAQTIADKYLQLGRDAHSSGDNVMAESYFQHAEHYLRILSAAQAYQQQMQQQFRRADEYDDEDGDEGEGDNDDTPMAEGQVLPGAGDQPDINGEPAEFEAERQQQQQTQRPPREFRNDRQGQEQGNREGGGQNRFRPRWQDRRDRQQNFNSETRGEQPAMRDSQPVMARAEEQPAVMAPSAPAASSEAPQWEAPSFLRRPAPIAPIEVEAAPAAEAVVEKRPRGRPRRERPAEESASSDVSETSAE